MVRGKVTEAGSDKPVAGAVVSYYVRDDNPFARGDITSWRTDPGEFVQTKADGTFEAAVYPGVGHLLAKGPTPDYVMTRIWSQELGHGKYDWADVHTHAVTAVNLKAGPDASEVNLKLQRGVKIAGRVVDADSKPVKQAELFYVNHLRDDRDRAYAFHYNVEPVPVKGVRFELTGCDPKAKLGVVVLDRKNQTGAWTMLSPEEQKEEPTIRLKPCAKATLRIVDDHGKPFIIKGGIANPMHVALNPKLHEELRQSDLLGPDYRDLVTDEKGRVNVPCLIPGADYRFLAGTNNHPFTAEAGKTHDLGEIIFRRSSGALP
jgi:hypothetical protein